MELDEDEEFHPKQTAIGRLHSINPAAGELYFLRMILFHVTEAK